MPDIEEQIHAGIAQYNSDACNKMIEQYLEQPSAEERMFQLNTPEIEDFANQVVSEVNRKFTALVIALIESSKLITSPNFVAPEQSLLRVYGKIDAEANIPARLGRVLYERLIQIYVVTIADKLTQKCTESVQVGYAGKSSDKQVSAEVQIRIGELAIKLCPLTLVYNADGARIRNEAATEVGLAVIAATGGSGAGLAVGLAIIAGGFLYDFLTE